MTIVLVTGGFDPLHSGHIAYFEAAKKLGDELWVGINSDAWLIRKKGRAFMPFKERATIVQNLKMVDKVIDVINDDTVDNAGGAIFKSFAIGAKKVIFANGGDRTKENIPEMKLWGDNPNVKFVFGVGGEAKQNSSSWILEEWKSPKTIRNWGWYRVLDDKPGYKVKELVIEPGKSLSMQRHQDRSEHWYILKGTCLVNTINISSDFDKLGLFKENQSFTIHQRQWHQGCNETKEPCHILEVQYGDQCIEEDIERK
ncbi:MAG: hypothetical protein CMA31_02750 [Euryarchaeota archaeon]|nr:hypothetical protein [Euryarchaeota archaeon]|tara:strand:- start:402 stop:1169 length:768 start_codon:yes stop_codon:yes gene_type:complete